VRIRSRPLRLSARVQQNPFARAAAENGHDSVRAEKRVKHTERPLFFYESVCVGRTHCAVYARALSRKALGIMQILTVYAPRREPNERDH
jgi:hypothetical protein